MFHCVTSGVIISISRINNQRVIKSEKHSVTKNGLIISEKIRRAEGEKKQFGSGISIYYLSIRITHEERRRRDVDVIFFTTTSVIRIYMLTQDAAEDHLSSCHHHYFPITILIISRIKILNNTMGVMRMMKVLFFT